MHEDEVETDRELVRSLLASQHPQWADLPIERVWSAGTDNAMYRLGDDLAVRLPRIHWAIESVAKERTWLPVLAPHLPLAVPLPVAHGEPEEVFPYPWSIVRWLPGEMATLDTLDNPVHSGARSRGVRPRVAISRRFRRTATSPGWPGSPSRRSLRRSVGTLRDELDGDAIIDAWSRVLEAPDYDGPPVWFHGDLAYLNLIAHDGTLCGVIDWGTCGVGDPAIETIIAWSLLPPDARAVYRDTLDIDDATWERGKGWVLTGVGAIPYYRTTNPILVADKISAIKALLEAST